MTDTLQSGPRDDGKYFKDKLDEALRFDPEIDSDNFVGYLDRVVNRLVDLSE